MDSNGKKRMCFSCRNDHYNHCGNSTTGECWSLASAKIVTRTRVGTWEEPPYVWTPRTTLSCHRPNGEVWLPREDVRVVRDTKEASATRAKWDAEAKAHTP